MLVTLDEMKAYLGISIIDPQYDVFLTTQIQTISEAIEGYCGRIFSLTNWRQTYYSDEIIGLNTDLRELATFHFPIVAVTSVSEKLTDVTNMPISTYRVHKPSGMLINKWGFFRYGCELYVEYSAGFATIPSVIKDVVFSLVQERFNKKKSGVDLNFGRDVQRISIPGSISIDFDYTLQSNDRQVEYGIILGNYVNVLGPFRSERKIIGNLGRKYVEPI